MKIALTCSSGGHFTEMRTLLEAFRGFHFFFVTSMDIDTKDLGEMNKTYYIRDSLARTFKGGKVVRWQILINYLVIILQSLWIILRERPHVIFSNGGDTTIPLCYIGKILGAKIIFLESWARVQELSFAGRIIYPIADLFLVQWPQLLQHCGPKARYLGNVL